MTIEQIAQNAGVSLVRDPNFDQLVASRNCAYMSPSDDPRLRPASQQRQQVALAFMIVDGKLARIDVLGDGFKTTQGLQVGSTEQEVHDAFPKGGALRAPRHSSALPTGISR